jgi:transcriptional regulator with XRE-family HTH domain
MTTEKELGERIKKLRGNKSQAIFAEEIGISRGSLSYYENGSCWPDAEIICRLCAICGISSDVLLGIADGTSGIDIKDVCNFTGLSLDIIKFLMSAKPMEINKYLSSIPREDVPIEYSDKTLGEKIRTARGKMSQKNFAAALGISQVTLGFYEKGERVPDANTIYKICKMCNISSDYLIGLSVNSNPEKGLKETCRYLELNCRAVQAIKDEENKSDDEKLIFGWLISSGYLSRIAEGLVNMADSGQKDTEAKRTALTDIFSELTEKLLSVFDATCKE